MADAQILPRMIRPRIEEALDDTPVLLIHGPRQCGKTTLALQIGAERGYDYYSLDDDVIRAAAEADPARFVADLPERVIIDEVQRAPGLFTAMKSAVDRDRAPGRFLLTGSANVLLVPRLADSLAGRIELVRLFPFAQCELEGISPAFLDLLFAGQIEARQSKRLGSALTERIVSGGYPAALARSAPHRRAAWYREYVATLVQRDVRDLARISSLDVLPRLLTLAAGQTARLLNISDLAGPFQLTRPTIRDYVTLLQQVFLVDELQPWHSNRLKRLVKTPKLHIGDTGVGASLLGMDAPSLYQEREVLGQLLETFVYQELRRQAGALEDEHRFFHFRDRDMYEVDIVIERGGRQVAGVEVKASSTVTEADFKGLRKLAAAAGRRFTAGVVLYDGESGVSFGDDLFAMPVRAIWEAGPRAE